jgi:hypothetical protein
MLAFLSIAALNNNRPILPNPFIATLTTIFSPSNYLLLYCGS